MAQITGVLRDGNKYKKTVTKKTKNLRFDNEGFRKKIQYDSLDLSSLCECENLERIVFYENPILSKDNIQDISQCKSLTDLTFLIDDEHDFSCFADLNLESLSIDSYKAGFDVLATMPNLKCLKKLYIKCYESTPLSLSNVPSSVTEITLSGPIENLNLMDLEHLNLTRLSLSRLAEGTVDVPMSIAKGLKGFYLTDCEYIGDFHTYPFEHSHDLRTFNFSNNGARYVLMDGLSQLKKLTTLITNDTTGMSIDADLRDSVKSPGLLRWLDNIGSP